MISNCKNNKTFKLGKGVTNYDMRGVSNVIKYAGITFAVLSLFSLILPIYSTFIAELDNKVFCKKFIFVHGVCCFVNIISIT